MVNIICFTKNNPIQLYALLESMRMFWPLHPKTHIIVGNSTKENYHGYSLVNKEFGEEVLFSVEEVLKEGVIDKVEHDKPYTMFLTDGDMFIRPLGINYLTIENNPMENSEVSVFAGKLGTCMKSAPKEKIYRWKNYQEWFGSMMPCNGHLFRTNDVLSLIRKSSFKTIEDFEDVISINDIQRPMIAIDEFPCLISIPNKDASLNDEFNKGKKIDLTPFMYLEPEYPNINIPIYLKWR